MVFALIGSVLLGFLVLKIIQFIIKRQELVKISDAIGSVPRHFLFGSLTEFPPNDPVGESCHITHYAICTT